MKVTLLLETHTDGYSVPIGVYTKKEDAYEVQRRWYCLGSKQGTGEYQIESLMVDLDSTRVIVEMEEDEAWWQELNK